MSMDAIPLRDIDGSVRHIRAEAVRQYLMASDFCLLGMSHAVIQRLRSEYLKMAGRMPMTEESVAECFTGRAHGCEHMTLATSDPESWVLLGDRCRLPHHPKWNYCPICGAEIPTNYSKTH